MDETNQGPGESSAEPMHRGGPGRLLGGVCLALARQLKINVALLRVGFVLAFAGTGGSVLLAYLALWVLVPATPRGSAPVQRVLNWLGHVTGPAHEESRWERRV